MKSSYQAGLDGLSVCNKAKPYGIDGVSLSGHVVECEAVPLTTPTVV